MSPITSPTIAEHDQPQRDKRFREPAERKLKLTPGGARTAESTSQLTPGQPPRFGIGERLASEVRMTAEHDGNEPAARVGDRVAQPASLAGGAPDPFGHGWPVAVTQWSIGRVFHDPA